MKSLTSFLLLRDETKSKSLTVRLRAAARDYKKKYGVAPDTFFVSAKAAPRDYHIGSISIIRKTTIMQDQVGVTLAKPAAS